MDKFEQLLSDSQFSMLLLGNEKTADFVLVANEPWADELQRDIERRELHFAGVLGIVDGRPRVALAVPMEEATVNALSQEFVSRAMSDPQLVEQLTVFVASSLASHSALVH